MQEIAKAFVVGVVTIGLATALFMNGRSTANVITASGNATSTLLGTAIKG